MPFQHLTNRGIITADDIPGLKPLDSRTGKEVQLAMQEIFLTGKLIATGGKLIIRHVFVSAEKTPLEIIYSFVLPRDASLRRFKVTGEGFSVRSELFPVKEATQKYEEGIRDGHLSTLARQYRDGNINLSVGNVRPGEKVTVYLEIIAGVDITDDGLRFRFPFTLAPCYHSNMRVGSVDSGTGEIELPAEEFGDVILPPFKADAKNLHRVNFDLSILMPYEIESMSSPSHNVKISLNDNCKARVSLEPEKDVPNRDLVLDVKMKAPFTGVLVGDNGEGNCDFVALIAAEAFGKVEASPRNVVFVVDRSGSMGGEPMDQARRAVLACIGSLNGSDRISLVAFDDSTEVFEPGLVPADDSNRQRLRQFISGIHSRGGTEMLAGIEEAYKIIGGEGGDIFLITDGQVFGTEDIIGRSKKLGIRIHCLGIGSSSQDRFLNLLARETSGVSRFITVRERIDRAALELFASAGRPVASGITARVEGMEDVAINPAPATNVFKNRPLVIYGHGKAGEGVLIIEWDADGQKRDMRIPIKLGEKETDAEILRLIRGARLITDYEIKKETWTGYEGESSAAKRKERERIEKTLEELGREYGLSNSMMSLVAVVERAGDKAGTLPRTTVVPVGMPEDTGFDAYFGDSMNRPISRAVNACLHRAYLMPVQDSCLGDCMVSPIAPKKHSIGAERKEDIVDIALKIAGMLRADGGMPGKDDRERIASSIVALMVFADAGKDDSFMFQSHIDRLIEFLENMDRDCLTDDEKNLLDEVIRKVRSGDVVQYEWKGLGRRLVKGTLKENAVWETLNKVF